MNSQLYNQEKQYPIPKNILVKIQAKLFSAGSENSGTKRAKNLVKTGYLTYPTLKRLKNFFDYLDPNTEHVQYELSGGNEMKQFVEKTLQSERSRTGISNQTNTTSMPTSAMDNTLRGADGNVNMDISETETRIRNKGSVVIVVNEEGKVLLVKRSPTRSRWMPNKWAFVGGKIENGEDPIEAARRECHEEAGLNLEHFVASFNFNFPPDTEDYVFVAKAPKNQSVKINEEHIDYGWFSLEEMAKLDAVPKIVECCDLALNKLKEKSIYK